MAGILDYLNQKKEQVQGLVGGAKQFGKDIAEGSWDMATKAVNPPRGDWINNGKRAFDANKYRVDQLSYPSDLLTPTYGGNYAIFYINISDASKLKLTEETVDLDTKTEARMRGSLVANAEKLAGHIDSVLGTAKQLAEKVGNIDVEAIKNTVPINARSQRRLRTAIALHIPNQLSIRYATMWGEAENTAGVQALMAAGNNGANAVGAAISQNGAAVKKNLTDAAANGIEYGASKLLANMPNKEAISGATGLAANPKKEQTFQGVDFRKFTFDYQFYPRNEIEAQNVLNIIHQFKLHMHPEFKSELNYVWIYPSEFDIIYYTSGVENLNVHKHTSCVLEAMSVNYTPNGNFSVFANGMPTQINISLDFKELQLASKETIGLTPGGL